MPPRFDGWIRSETTAAARSAGRPTGGFLNSPTDSFTSLTQLGARAYNPVTGKFLSVDPVLDPEDPQQNKGYSYAANNPTSNSDPSGLRFACDSGDCDKNGVDHSQATSGGCGTRACGNDPGNSLGSGGGGKSQTSPGGSSNTTIRITAHVSVDASAPNAAKLIAAFNAYAASVKYLDGYGGTYAQAYNESLVWSSFCNTKGSQLCGQQVTTQWNEIYNTVSHLLPVGGDSEKAIQALNANQLNQFVIHPDSASSSDNSPKPLCDASIPVAGIYIVVTAAGTYVGQSVNIARRLAEHVRNPKSPITQADADNAEKIPVEGAKLDREVQEQLKIDVLGGVDNLLNLDAMPEGYSR